MYCTEYFADIHRYKFSLYSCYKQSMPNILTGEMTENCACNVYQLGGGLVVSTETCLLRRLDPETLESPSKIDLSGMVNIACARALTDPKTKEVFNLAGTFLTGLKYHFIR